MSASVKIHPTAVVNEGAELDEGVEIGPYAIIGSNVKLGKSTKVHGHALVTGHTTMGPENEVFSYASVGNTPQDLKYKGEPTTLEVGAKNVFREFVTVQPGTVTGIGTTKIGNGNLIMAYVHIAHDCILGNQNVLTNLTQLSGHVTVGNNVVFGGVTAVHQHTTIGDRAMTAGGTIFSLDLPPYCVAMGYRGGLRGLNIVGLQRAGVNSATRAAIKEAYKIVFLENHGTIQSALANVPERLLEINEVKSFIDFIRNSKQGVMRPFTDRRLSELLNES